MARFTAVIPGTSLTLERPMSAQCEPPGIVTTGRAAERLAWPMAMVAHASRLPYEKAMRLAVASERGYDHAARLPAPPVVPTPDKRRATKRCVVM